MHPVLQVPFQEVCPSPIIPSPKIPEGLNPFSTCTPPPQVPFLEACPLRKVRIGHDDTGGAGAPWHLEYAEVLNTATGARCVRCVGGCALRVGVCVACACGCEHAHEHMRARACLSVCVRVCGREDNCEQA